VVLVGEHGLDVAPDQGEEQGHAQAGGDQVEQGGLGVFVNMHHGDCSQEASQVREESSVKVEVAVPLEADIVSEEKGNEDPGDDDISKPQHGSWWRSGHSQGDPVGTQV